MNKEINAATGFLCNLLKRCSRGELVDVDNFDRCLQRILTERYQNHWFPERPFRGSGYRCIRINHSVEPLLKRAADESGLGVNFLNNLPNELTIWVDPKEVSYRIGEDGSIGVLYSGEDELDKKNGNETAPVAEKTNRNQTSASNTTTSRSCNQQFYNSSDHHHHNINIRQLAAFVSS
ncbi:protein BTG2-like [Tubulanus polymorphus]|uniref:protein BTG2-like n=1 Tax=Tubulanus polymorphus TaxID=672921 RepID=UPI003DA5D1DD